MKKFCLLCALLCILLTTACCSPKTTEKDIKLQGQTEAVWYTVKAPVEGEIRGLILDKGERIRKNQPLFGLGTQDASPEVEKAATELAKAQAQLNRASRENNERERSSAAAALQTAQSEVQTAEQNYAKMQRLFTIGGVSRQKTEQARLNLEAANAGLAAAQARFQQVSREYTPEELEKLKQDVEQAKTAYDATVLTVEGSEIASPATGIVKEIFVKNGERVQKGQPVMKLLSSTECTVKISVSLSDPRIREGTEATVTPAGSKKSFPAVIRQLGQNSLVLFSDRKPEDLPEGASVDVRINVKGTAD